MRNRNGASYAFRELYEGLGRAMRFYFVRDPVAEFVLGNLKVAIRWRLVQNCGLIPKYRGNRTPYRRYAFRPTIG